MNLNSHKAWIEIKDYTIIVFGLVLYAFGWTSFLLTNEITTGGIAGVSALIFFGTKIPVAISYFTLNALLANSSNTYFGNTVLHTHHIRSHSHDFASFIFRNVYKRTAYYRRTVYVVHHRRNTLRSRNRYCFHP